MSKLIKRGEKYFIKNSEPKIDEECIKRGMEEEGKEHPSMDEKQIKQIVMDHLKMDKEYYGEEDEEDDKESD